LPFSIANSVAIHFASRSTGIGAFQAVKPTRIMTAVRVFRTGYHKIVKGKAAGGWKTSRWA